MQVMDMKKRQAEYYDSMGVANKLHWDLIK